MPPKSKKSSSSKGPTKREIVDHISSSLGTEKKVVDGVLETLQSLAEHTLSRNEKFTIPGIVTLSVKERKATHDRPGRNPSTGEQITIRGKPAGKKLVAKPRGDLKSAVIG